MWLGAPVGVYLPVGAEQVSVASDNLLGLGVPHYELLAAVLHRVKLIYVGRLACAAARGTKCLLAEPSYLQHDVGRLLGRYHVYLVMALVGHTELPLGRQLGLEQLPADGLYDILFHNRSICL